MLKDEVLREFSNKSVLVTGGTGMIGREVACILANAGAHVRTVSLDQLQVHEKVESIFGDLTDFGFCQEITKETDFVFHVAGIKGSVDVVLAKPASFFVPQLMFNTNVLEACRRNKVKKFLYTSTIGAYGNAEVFKEREGLEPDEPMDGFPGWAKRVAEMQVQTYRIQYGMENISIVRPCNVYGPGDNFDPNNAMVIPTLMYRIAQKENPVLVWGDGSAIRDFAFSRDVAEGVILALHHGTKGRYVNLGSGRGYSIRELVETLHSFLDFNYRFDTTKPSGYPRRVMDMTLAKEMIHFEASTPLLDGLKETWNWFVDHQDEFKKKQNYLT